MASHDAKSLNPRKWMSEEQQVFSPPLGFILYERKLEMLCQHRLLSKLQVKSTKELNRDYKSG